jgi:hypothetical protein
VTPAISFNRAASRPTGRAPRTSTRSVTIPSLGSLPKGASVDFLVMILPARAAAFARLGARLTLVAQRLAFDLNAAHRKFLIGANGKDLSQSAAARLV